MKKINLYAIGNQKNFNYYVFDNTLEVVEVLAKVFREIFELEWIYWENVKDKKGEWIQKRINYKNKKDLFFNIGVKGKKRIDVFVGNKRIFVLIHCSLKQREKFNSKLGEISSIFKQKDENN